MAYLEVTPRIKGNKVSVELTDFSVFYSQDSIVAAEAELKDKKSKIVVEKGQIVKVSKDEKGVVTKEQLTTKWSDWVDYWAVDFDFERKREVIRVKKELSATGQNRLEGMRERATQDSRQGRGHLRKRHDEGDRGQRMTKLEAEFDADWGRRSHSS